MVVSMVDTHPIVIGVTGASGWLGSNVTRQLLDSGYLVRRFVRRANNPHDIELDLEGHSSAWRSGLVGCHAVIHCAARVHIKGIGASDLAAFRRVNRDGTARLVREAQDANIKRFVLASTIAVYGREGEADHFEDGPTDPSTGYGISKLEAEASVVASRGDWSICRLSTVFGHGDRANFAALAFALKRRRFVVPGRGEARKSVVPVSLAAAALISAATEPAWSRRIVNVALPVAPSLCEICYAFQRSCGFPNPWHVPVHWVRAAAKVCDALTSIGFRTPLSGEVLAKLQRDTVVSTRLLRNLWPAVSFPSFETALEEAAKYYRDECK